MFLVAARWPAGLGRHLVFDAALSVAGSGGGSDRILLLTPKPEPFYPADSAPPTSEIDLRVNVSTAFVNHGADAARKSAGSRRTPAGQIRPYAATRRRATLAVPESISLASHCQPSFLQVADVSQFRSVSCGEDDSRAVRVNSIHLSARQRALLTPPSKCQNPGLPRRSL